MNPSKSERSRVLIVDDIEENLIALEAVLSSLDLELVRAYSGEEALKAMLRDEFALVLLDVLMPGMDGFETAANIKRLDQTKDVPIILLTGTDAETDYAYRGYAIGAADFLTKPIDPWLLRTKVNVFLELHRKNRQLAAQAEQLQRRLTDEPRPAAPMPPAAPPGSPETSRRPPRQAADAPPPAADRLAEITERLVQIELLLRDAGDFRATDLADRITDLEDAVNSLRASRQI